MGKTRTSFIEDAPEKKQSGKKKYELKKKAQVTNVGLKGGERIKVVGGDLPEEPKKKAENKKADKKKVVQAGPKARSQSYQDVKSKIDPAKLYSVSEAVKLIKDNSHTKFDSTVELHLVVKKKGLSVNVTLPFSTGKAKKIEVASEKTIKKLKDGKIDFDVLLATPEFMQKLVPFARLLGPKGMMPNPKNGTLIKTAADAKKFSVDNLVVKTERKEPLIHAVVGKVSQSESELIDNTTAMIEAIGNRQILKIFLKSTMSPSVKIKVN